MKLTATFVLVVSVLVVVVVIIQGKELHSPFQVFWNAFFSPFAKKKPAGKLV